MILNNKKQLILSSLLILLPIPVGLLLWNRFPEFMTTHWGFDGQPDGMQSRSFAIFFAPLVLLATHWLCILFTAKDPGNRERNRKPLTMVLWIIPLLSNLSSGMMYALALGVELAVPNLMVAAMGLMFAVIGNYLPKCRMNSTMGIKVPWAYTSEENWNATHRFGGRVWVIGGIVMALGSFLPESWSIIVTLIATVLLSITPIVYSYRFYRKEKALGKAFWAGYSATDAKITKVSGVIVLAILVFCAVLMFTGNLDYRFGDEAFTIEASWYSDLTLQYDAITSVEYREGNVSGVRVGGFGSFRLLMGYFENEEFGTYTRYTYDKPEACIVITAKGKTLVLSGVDAEATQAIYQTLLEKCSN